jgi:hypothetical protein
VVAADGEVDCRSGGVLHGRTWIRSVPQLEKKKEIESACELIEQLGKIGDGWRHGLPALGNGDGRGAWAIGQGP